MTQSKDANNHVHLVGSIGLPSAEEVFSTCGRTLGRRLKRLPDGEVGGRRQWISWQVPLLRSMPFLETVDPSKGPFSLMRLKSGFDPAEIEFGELGYSREARASYEDFVSARKRGDIKEGVRFMVALPTPYAVLSPFVDVASYPVLEPAYTQAMAKEVERICAAIPHYDLAIQWDVAIEMLQWDATDPRWQWPLGGDGKAEMIRRLAYLGGLIPPDVELGYHLCYGDMDSTHYVHPKDAAPMVELSNRLVEASSREINWIHMPADRRTDDDFYRPLADLRLQPATELYLGVVNPEDGVTGAKDRVAVASRHVKDFGIATECGFARVRTPALARQLIEIQAQATPEPAA